MHRQHAEFQPQQVICPSHPTHAPLNSFLPLLIMQSLTKYLHKGLSEPSITKSQSSNKCKVSLVIKGCLFISKCGFKFCNVHFNDSVLGFPTEAVQCPTCLCKLVISTTSESNKPNVPTPAPARYNPKGHPIPPEPINATLDLHIFNCPQQPIYFKSICLEQRVSKSPNSGYYKLVSNGPLTNCFAGMGYFLTNYCSDK